MCCGEMDAPSESRDLKLYHERIPVSHQQPGIRLCLCVYVVCICMHDTIPVGAAQNNFHSPLRYNESLCASLKGSDWLHALQDIFHIDLCFLRIHLKACQLSCRRSHYDANWIWAGSYLHNDSLTSWCHLMFVRKHIDGDISFMDSSQHIMGY